MATAKKAATKKTTSWEVVVVNCDKLYVRSGPGKSYKVLKTVNKNYKTTASKTKNGWYYLDSKKGWCSGGYLKVKKKTTTKKTSKKSAKKDPPLKKPPSYSKKELLALKLKNKLKLTLAKKAKGTQAIQFDSLPANVKGNQDDSAYEIDEELEDELISPTWVPDSDEGSEGPNTRKLRTLGLSTVYKDFSFIRDVIPNKQYSSEIFPLDRNGVNSAVEPYGKSNIAASLATIKKNLGHFDDTDYEKLFTHFNRFKRPVPDYNLVGAMPYVFFTRPGLRLFDSKSVLLPTHKDTFFEWMDNNFRDATRSLTHHFKNKQSGHHFNPFLSNAAESFELSDEVIKTVDHGNTYTGWKLMYARNSIDSNAAGQFNVSYTDSKELTVYNMHKLWVEYMDKMQRGYLIPAIDYTHKKVIDYACSVYFFLTASDGETILYWAKYTGVFPLNTPSSAYSWTKGQSVSLPKFTINYAYSFREEMKPIILSEFNYLSRALKDTTYVTPYDFNTGGLSRQMVGVPYVQGDIVGDDKNKRAGKYRLRFRMP